MRQDEDEFTEQNSEDVRPHSSSYRQTLSLDPIASQSLNLETSATRLARVLLVSIDRIYRICTFTHTHIYIYLSLSPSLSLSVCNNYNNCNNHPDWSNCPTLQVSYVAKAVCHAATVGSEARFGALGFNDPQTW